MNDKTINQPTTAEQKTPTHDQDKPIEDPVSKAQVDALAKNAADFGLTHFGMMNKKNREYRKLFQREISVNTSTIHHFEIIFDNPDFSRLFVPFSHDTLHI